MQILKDKLVAALKKCAADVVCCGNIERMRDPAVIFRFLYPLFALARYIVRA